MADKEEEAKESIPSTSAAGASSAAKVSLLHAYMTATNNNFYTSL